MSRSAPTKEVCLAKHETWLTEPAMKQAGRFIGLGISLQCGHSRRLTVRFCEFDTHGLPALMRLVEMHTVSLRPMDRLAKVVRTVADLGNSETAKHAQVEEAATFVTGGMMREGFSRRRTLSLFLFVVTSRRPDEFARAA